MIKVCQAFHNRIFFSLSTFLFCYTPLSKPMSLSNEDNANFSDDSCDHLHHPKVIMSTVPTTSPTTTAPVSSSVQHFIEVNIPPLIFSTSSQSVTSPIFSSTETHKPSPSNLNHQILTHTTSTTKPTMTSQPLSILTPLATPNQNTHFKNPKITPPSFSGSENVTDYFINLESAIIVNGWNCELVPFFIDKHLTKEALSFFQYLKKTFTPLTYTTFKQKFIDQFTSQNLTYQYQIQLDALTMSEKSLMDYVFQVKTLCHNLKLPDNFIIFHILKGLPPQIKSLLTLYPHDTLDQLDDSLRKFNLRTSELSTETPVAKTTETTVAELIQRIELQEQQINALKSSNTSNFKKHKRYNNSSKPSNEQRPDSSQHNSKSPSQTESSNQCPICDGKHSKVDCNIQFCRYCKSLGHTITTCPDPKCKISKNNSNLA